MGGFSIELHGKLSSGFDRRALCGVCCGSNQQTMIVSPSGVQANSSFDLLIIQTICRNEDRVEQGHDHRRALKEMGGRVSDPSEISFPASAQEFVDVFCICGNQMASVFCGLGTQACPGKDSDHLLQLAHQPT